jgi:hypothetical protein
MKIACAILLQILAIFANIHPNISFPSPASTLRKWTTEVEPLDPENKYLASWEVDLDAETVVFSVTVETRGFVGFGISPGGSMSGADIFIGGVDSISGFNYYFDMHGIGNQAPVRDEHSDYNLLAAAENGTHTMLKFSRKLNTCDNQDYAITEDTTRIIWSYGQTDDIQYHGANRGSISFNVIAPPTPPIDLTKYERWEMTTNSVMTSNDTSYFCTIHKSPNFLTKHHIVALGPVLPTVDAKKHTHHFQLSICIPEPGQSEKEAFEPWLYPAYPGHECYVDNPMPFHLCMKVEYIWAVGGKMTIFPENLGLPTSTGEAYYMLEIHYDNPGLEQGKQFKTGLEMYHTTELRETEVGIYMAGHSSDDSLVIPPNTADFAITTTCPSVCSQAGIPSTGINIFNVLLHSHLSGRKIKFRQFRAGTELPWILADEHYDFNFQQNKPLRNEVLFLPGDELRVECTYDANWKNGKVVLGGLSTREEMCVSIFYYYPKIEMDSCTGRYPFPALMEEFGVTNYTFDQANPTGQTRLRIISPPELAGDWEDVLNTKFNWTPGFIEQLKEKSKFEDKEYFCGQDNGIAKYPVFDKEYAPEDKCVK